ncbi:hypothetical protein DL767_000902 [Monosporascus sp. MG133]|nr:hypothetical protein DL767_000902 [Monosporascus sp. MG133]
MSTSQSTTNHFRPASPVPATSRLRDSCHACAVSKVKCHREKPSCSRCVKRGITCVYVATRRGGRKHSAAVQKGTNNDNPVCPRDTFTVNKTPLVQSLGVRCSTESTVSDVNSISPQEFAYHSPQTTLSSDSGFGLFCNLLSPEEQSLSSLVTDVGTDFGSLDIPFSVSETSSTDIFTDFSFFEDTSAQSTSTLPDATSTDIATSTTDFSRPSTKCTTPSRDNPCLSSSQSEDGPCSSCMEHALSLMGKAFLRSTTSATASAMPTMQDIIDKNKHVIESVGVMLRCSCSNDGYLLAIICLIVLKVLSRYDVAARKGSSPTSDYGNPRCSASSASSSPYRSELTTGPLAVGDHCLDGEDSDRMAAQLVLGELHRVQRLFHQLTTKLEMLAAKKRGDISRGTSLTETEKMPSISALAVDQVGTDIRNRLQWLSKDIIKRLNKE